MDELFALLEKLWKPFQRLGRVLNYCRFSLFVVLAGGAGLLLTDQGREIGLRVTENLLHAAAFYVAILLWAFQSWFWARHVVDDRFGSSRGGTPSERRLANHVPRIIGAGAYLLAAAALMIAWRERSDDLAHVVLTVLVILTGIAFYVFVVKRRDLMRQLLEGTRWERDGDYLDLIYVWLKWFTLVYAGLLTLLACIAPAGLGFALGSAAILFLALSSIVPVGGWLVYRTRRFGFPVVTALLVLALAFSFFNDNHKLRLSSNEPERETLDAALLRWGEQAPTRTDGARPFVVVATAGGGLRAAQWTATVLGGLSDIEPRFRSSLFAISGVSGGSVGASFVTAAWRQGATACEAARSEERMRGETCYEWQAREALARDFLGPTFAGMMYPDLLQRFFPLPINALPDRAEALERGWVRSWASVSETEPEQGLAMPFTALWADRQSWLPALLLNGTHQESGKRIVASHLDLSGPQFVDLIELYNVIERDVPVSTAAVNSARFPYVSPPGTLPCKPSDLDSGFFCNRGHVLDGGYFENFGAVTARELMRAADDNQRLPIAILISSDPELVPEDGMPDTIHPDTPMGRLEGRTGGNETLGPVYGMLNTRSARGILAAKSLGRWIADHPRAATACGGPDGGAGACVFHFRMGTDNGPVPALGWLLSPESETAIWRMLSCHAHNRSELGRLLHTLGTPAETIDRATRCFPEG